MGSSPIRGTCVIQYKRVCGPPRKVR